MWLNKKTDLQVIRHAFASLLVLLALVACQIGEQYLAFQTIAKSGPHDLGMFTYQEREPAIMVITRREEIDDPAYAVLSQHPLLAPLLRRLDFEHDFYVLALLGERNASGYTITIRRISRQNNRVTVEAESTQPGQGDLVVWASTSPYHLVAVSRELFNGEQVHFAMVVDGQPAAECTHFIP